MCVRMTVYSMYLWNRNTFKIITTNTTLFLFGISSFSYQFCFMLLSLEKYVIITITID